MLYKRISTNSILFLYLEILERRNGRVKILEYDCILSNWKDWFKVKYGTTWKLKLIRWLYKPVFDKQFQY